MNEWIRWLLEWANDNPAQFLYTVLIILSPFFLISAFLSWKLAKHIESEEKKKKQKAKKIENIKSRKRN